MKVKLTLFLVCCLSWSQSLLAQAPKWVEKAKEAVFSIPPLFKNFANFAAIFPVPIGRA